MQWQYLLSQQELGAIPGKELKKAHIHTDDSPALVDVFMTGDDALDTEDNEMYVTDHELGGGQILLCNEQAGGELSEGQCEGEPVRA